MPPCLEDIFKDYAICHIIFSHFSLNEGLTSVEKSVSNHQIVFVSEQSINFSNSQTAMVTIADVPYVVPIVTSGIAIGVCSCTKVGDTQFYIVLNNIYTGTINFKFLCIS